MFFVKVEAFDKMAYFVVCCVLLLGLPTASGLRIVARANARSSATSIARSGRHGTELRARFALNAASTPFSDDDPDVIVIGSGIGGLSCAALLAASNLKVHVLESHYEIGGCAHEFCYREDGTCVPSDRLSPADVNNVYRFEAGELSFELRATATMN